MIIHNFGQISQLFYSVKWICSLLFENDVVDEP